MKSCGSLTANKQGETSLSAAFESALVVSQRRRRIGRSQRGLACPGACLSTALKTAYGSNAVRMPEVLRRPLPVDINHAYLKTTAVSLNVVS